MYHHGARRPPGLWSGSSAYGFGAGPRDGKTRRAGGSGADLRETAENYYRTGQFYCSEAIVKAINDGFGLNYPDAVVRLASGFPIGIGGAGCSCGAVTGGVMALGMVFGRDQPEDPRIDRCLGLCRELHTSFAGRHGCLCCRTLTHGMVLKSPEHMRQCVTFTGEVAEEVAKIILRELENPAGIPCQKTSDRQQRKES